MQHPAETWGRRIDPSRRPEGGLGWAQGLKPTAGGLLRGTVSGSRSSGDTSDAGPALAVKGKKLIESWIGAPSLKVSYSSFNGKKWAVSKTVPDASITVETGPGLAEFGHSLVTAWDPGSAPSAIDYSFGS